MNEVSAREAEVLAALADHRSNAQIARALHISVRTVESHVSSLLRKYGVTDRRELADLAGSHRGPGMSGLPAGRTTFVGRSTEATAVRKALGQSRLVTVLGPGGMGKTRLAAVVAAESGAAGAFVDLVPVRDGLVSRAVATALGLTERPPQSLEQVLIEQLQQGRWLLVLDNCEHLVDEVAALAEQLLRTCPEVTILATSRERLGVPAEATVLLPPLDAAVELFADRARAVDPAFTASTDELAEICARLDGMPLAIELAAARIGSLGAEGLQAALDDRLRLLAGGRGVDARHRSLGAVIGWSYELLDDQERLLFRRLSIYVGGFDLDAASATSPELGRGEVADLLGRLTDKSLAVRRGSRWRLLETIREFARDQLTEAELTTAQNRCLHWAATTAAALESRLDGSDWQQPYDEVAGDLRAALATTTTASHPTAAAPHPTPAASDPTAGATHPTAGASDPTAAATHLRAGASDAAAGATHLGAAAPDPAAAATHLAAGASDPAAATTHLEAAASDPSAAAPHPTAGASDPAAAVTHLEAAAPDPTAGETHPTAGATDPAAAAAHLVAGATDPAAAATDLGAAVPDMTAGAADPTAHRLARALGHLGFARREFREAIGYYREAAERAPDGVAAALDLRSAADATLAVSDAETGVRLLLDAADRAVADGNVRATMLALAVIAANRYPTGSLYDLSKERSQELLQQAVDSARPGDSQVTALLATAKAWEHGGRRIGADPELAQEAVDAARRTGDPVLIAGALDALTVAAGNAGRLRDARSYAVERMQLVGPLPRHEPYAAAEIIDAFHVAPTTATAVGDLPAALAAVGAPDDPVGDHPYISLPRLIRVCALTGQFDVCVEQADALWERWQGAGAPPIEWMASALSAAAMVHGLRDDGLFDVWQSRALEVARCTDDVEDAPWLAAPYTFAQARVAVQHADVRRGDVQRGDVQRGGLRHGDGGREGGGHGALNHDLAVQRGGLQHGDVQRGDVQRGGLQPAEAVVRRAFGDFSERWWVPYARAAAAELAVVANLPDAAEFLVATAPEAVENDWAAACLARATARSTGDLDGLLPAAEAFDRIGAQFERAYTLSLHPDHVSDALQELAAFQVPVP
ncbi:ATP-binding protein [Kribbella sp. NPDC058693]|uniref:ATP-binding protein n=1 Tax=Kribbella sp. NPDC058693 TaxID=3346602 RepID=UPI003668A7E7